MGMNSKSEKKIEEGFLNMRYKKVKDLPRFDRPREKLANYGPQRLSNVELIAILLDTGIRKRDVFSLSKQVERVLWEKSGRVSLSDLMQIKGLGLAKASRIVAGLELGNRVQKKKSMEINSPEVVWHISMDVARSKKEVFLVLFLDVRNREIYRKRIAVGTLDSVSIHPREIFEPAINVGAVSLILVHNHPSGVIQPSEEDVRFTKRIIEGGRILGIEVLDHLIVSEQGYCSMREEGYL